MRRRLPISRVLTWAVAGLLLAGLAGACAEEETKERFDDDDATGGTGLAPTGSGGAGATTTGTSTGTGTGTSTGTGTAPPCSNDNFEPNNSESEATYLGEINDCDGSGGVIDAMLEGTEFDWYWYRGLDQLGCSVGAYREPSAGATVRVCAYFQCDGLSLTCPDGTSADVSPGGRSGCCATEAFSVSPDCSGMSDDADVYIRVDKPPTPHCLSYSLSYHY